MKILAIGDFHGKFPVKLKNLVKRVDLIVSVGDYFPFSYRKIWFKHCYKSDTELWGVVGKKKYSEWVKKDLKSGEKVLKQLNKIKIPIISVTGNLDYTKWEDAIDGKRSKWKWAGQDFFSKIIKKYKKIKIFDYSYLKFNDVVFIGMAKSTFPGRVKSKNYKKYRKKLDKLFRKFKNKKIIFVSHHVPYKTKLDKLISKEAPEKVRGRSNGSKLTRRIIERYQPVLNIAGHMHENQGKDKIGKTMIINTGAAHDGKAAIIDFDEKKKKVNNVKFVR